MKIEDFNPMNLFSLGLPKMPESVLRAGSKAFSVAVPALQVGVLALIVVAVAKGIFESVRNPSSHGSSPFNPDYDSSDDRCDCDDDASAPSYRYVDRWTSEPINYPSTPVIVEKEVIREVYVTREEPTPSIVTDSKDDYNSSSWIFDTVITNFDDWSVPVN